MPLAAAMQMKRGMTLYRDVFFDKPLLVPAVYLLWGAQAGWALRVAGAVYALAASALAFGIGAALWTRREGLIAAGLMAFFLTFDTHSAVLPLTADMLLLVPHLAAVLLAVKKRPLLAGIAAGVGFLFNAKGVIVLAACALFAWPSVLQLGIGFVLPNLRPASSWCKRHCRSANVAGVTKETKGAFNINDTRSLCGLIEVMGRGADGAAAIGMLSGVNLALEGRTRLVVRSDRQSRFY